MELPEYISDDTIEITDEMQKEIDSSKKGKSKPGKSDMTKSDAKSKKGREGGKGGGRGGGAGGFDPNAIIKRMMESDKNGDGKLAEDEVSERMKPMFGRADADKDGFITQDELKKMFSGFGGGGGRGGGRGGPGGGRGGPGGGGGGGK